MNTKYITIPIRMYGNALEIVQYAACDLSLAVGIPEVLWVAVYTEKVKLELLKIADDLDTMDEMASIIGATKCKE